MYTEEEATNHGTLLILGLVTTLFSALGALPALFLMLISWPSNPEKVQEMSLVPFVAGFIGFIICLAFLAAGIALLISLRGGVSTPTVAPPPIPSDYYRTRIR